MYHNSLEKWSNNRKWPAQILLSTVLRIAYTMIALYGVEIVGNTESQDSTDWSLSKLVCWDMYIYVQCEAVCSDRNRRYIRNTWNPLYYNVDSHILFHSVLPKHFTIYVIFNVTSLLHKLSYLPCIPYIVFCNKYCWQSCFYLLFWKLLLHYKTAVSISGAM